MKNHKGSELEAYSDGIDASYRINKYKGCKTMPECPYPKESKEEEA